MFHFTVEDKEHTVTQVIKMLVFTQWMHPVKCLFVNIPMVIATVAVLANLLEKL